MTPSQEDLEREVEYLKRYQRTGNLHPYTCGKRDRKTHPFQGGDFGILEPRAEGSEVVLFCPWCDYRQVVGPMLRETLDERIAMLDAFEQHPLWASLFDNEEPREPESSQPS